MLDDKQRKGYTDIGSENLDNRIESKNVPLPTVPFREVAGCKVSLSFAQEDNASAEKAVTQILEHEFIRRTGTGGM